MKSNKELNEMIASILNEPKLYDLRAEFRIVEPNLTLEEAQTRYQAVEPENKHLYSITSSREETPYIGDLNNAMHAAKTIAKKNNHTFVLSIEDGNYKASYGSYSDHAEFIGYSPSYCTCMAILKFLGKL